MALRVWDVLLFERQRTVLFRVALGLMEMHRAELLAAREGGEARPTQCLSPTPGLVWGTHSHNE